VRIPGPAARRRRRADGRADDNDIYFGLLTRDEQALISRWITTVLVLACCGCRAAASPPPLVQPGAPGESVRAITPQQAVDLPAVRHTDAETRFMQGMIAHHAQALEMTTLAAERSARDDLKLMAQRIALSQADEIKLMQDWLARRSEAVPEAHAHHSAAMPGMLTEAEMNRLAGAKGVEFDRLFVELMIKHHGGALMMVDELRARPDSGQDPELQDFASDVDADQRAEIARLAVLLKELSR
jgi:uncharacterized protein (DUF305 family)